MTKYLWILLCVTLSCLAVEIVSILGFLTFEIGKMVGAF